MPGIGPRQQPRAVGAQPVAGDEQARPGQLRARDAERALPEIVVEGEIDGIDHIAEARHQIRDGPVAVAGAQLGFGDHAVDVELRIPGLRAQQVAQRGDAVAGIGQQLVGDHDRPRIDVRIAGDPLLHLQLDEVVERGARGLPAHPLPDLAVLAPEHQGEGEDLGDALDGERNMHITVAVDGTVDRGDADAELVRVDLRQARDVVGDLSGADLRARGGHRLR
nr:hypothetical protein [Nocardia mexicana]